MNKLILILALINTAALSAVLALVAQHPETPELAAKEKAIQLRDDTIYELRSHTSHLESLLDKLTADPATEAEPVERTSQSVSPRIPTPFPTPKLTPVPGTTN